MASFGIYDGTDDEPEDERLAREAREKVLREEAAAESQKFRDSNPFSDGVTTGADGGSGPITLDPFNVVGVRETPEEKEWREWRERTIAEAGGQNPVTVLNPFDPTRESAADREIRLAKEAQMRDFDISGITPKPDTITIGDPSKTITVPTDTSIVGVPPGETPEQAIARIDAAEKALEDAARVEARRLNQLNPLGPVFNAVKSAATGAWEVIKDPGQGLSNIATNLGGIFNPNADTNVIPLPIPAAVGAGITIAGLANPNDLTRATDRLNKAQRAAADGRRNGVSESDQKELDDDLADARRGLEIAKGNTPAQGGATAIGAGVGAGAAAGGAGAGAAAGGAGAAAGATQGGSTSVLTGQTVPAATGVGSVPAVGPAVDVRTPEQIEQARLDAIATTQQQKAAQDAAWGRVGEAQATARADAGSQTTVIYPTADDCRRQGRVLNAAGTACVDRVLTQADCTSQGLVLNDQGTACVAGGGTNTKCPDGSDRPANGSCPVVCTGGKVKDAANNCVCPTGYADNGSGTCIVVSNCNLTTHEVVNGACVVKCGSNEERNAQGTCVVKCGSGQERNAQGVCVVKPTTITPDPALILPIPSNPFTMSTITEDQRDLPGELEKTAAAFKLRRNELKELYGNALNDYTDADIAAFDKVSKAMRGTNVANTEAASAQTIAANRALRDANLADVNRLGGAALLNRQTLNSQLYGNLNQYSTEASAALGRDMDALRLAEAKQLSPEDIRNSQQAAREAWSARGLVNSRGAVGAEILNRDSLARQREAEARAKVQQSYGNLQQATAMEMANVFDPQAAILGGQYGMQTQNYGTNAALYGQAANQMAGSQNYVQKVFNPMGEYPNNIYDFNANATTAARIAEANNAAAVAAAREAGQYGLAGAALKSGWVQDAATGTWKFLRSALGGS